MPQSFLGTFGAIDRASRCSDWNYSSSPGRLSKRNTVENTGIGKAIIASKILGKGTPSRNINAETDEYAEIPRAYMIDPVSVAWLAIQDTPSVAEVFVIMEMMADDRPEMTRRIADGSDVGHERLHRTAELAASSVCADE